MPHIESNTLSYHYFVLILR